MGVDSFQALATLHTDFGSGDPINLMAYISLVAGAAIADQVERVTAVISWSGGDPTLAPRMAPDINALYNNTPTQISGGGLKIGFPVALNRVFQITGRENLQNSYFQGASDNTQGFDMVIESAAGGGRLVNPFTAIKYGQFTLIGAQVLISQFGFSAYELASADKAIVCAAAGDIRVTWDVSGVALTNATGIFIPEGESITVFGNDNIRNIRVFNDVNSAASPTDAGIMLETLGR